MQSIGSYPLNEIITGDSRLLAQSIPDNSIDMIFTDPVYENIEDYAWLAETAARILKPNRALVAFYYPKFHLQVGNAMSQHLTYQEMIIWHRNNEMKFRYSPVGKSVYVPAYVFSKGEKLSRPGFAFNLRSYPVWSVDSNHKWSKPPEFLAYYLEALSRVGEVVYEPFAGGGSMLSVCKQFERNFISSEILPETADIARKNLLQTMFPLGLGRSLTKRAADGGNGAAQFENFE